MATLALRRAGREGKAVYESKALQDMGIYYRINEDNIMKGTAMLVGKEGTPYVGGFYFFDVEFPNDYPHAPMKVKSLTQDGKTRFNPNLYTCGKVCLSILNTWQGPSWNVTQTLETVLLSIMSMVLNEHPIANEPGWEQYVNKEKGLTYNRIIFHANVRTAILDMMKSPPKFAVPFKDEMEKEFEKNKTMIQKALEKELPHDGKEINGALYSLYCKYQFKSLLAKINGEDLTVDATSIKSLPPSPVKQESILPKIPGYQEEIEIPEFLDEPKKSIPSKFKITVSKTVSAPASSGTKKEIKLPSVETMIPKKEEQYVSKTVSAPLPELSKSSFDKTKLEPIKLANHPGLNPKHLKADNESLTNIIFDVVDHKKMDIIAIGKYSKLSEGPVSPDYEHDIEELTEEEIKTLKCYRISYVFTCKYPEIPPIPGLY